MIDGVECLFEVVFIDTQDDVKLARTLVDHADVDICVRQCVANASGGTLCLNHTAANHSKECETVLENNAVGTNALVEAGKNLFTMLVEHRGGNDHAQGVDARGEMLKADVIVLEYVENLSTKADFGIHHILFNGDNRESLLAGDTCDHSLCIVVAGGGNDHRAGSLWLIGVTNVDRNARVTNGEDRILVQNGRAHVGKLTQLTVGDGANGTRILHDAGVGHEKSGYVGPVLIQLGISGSRHDGAGHVRAAAAEGLDGAVGHHAIEAGNDGIGVLLQLLAQQTIGVLLVIGAVVLEADHRLGVNEAEAEVFCQNDGVEVFTAAGSEVAAGVVLNTVLNIFELARDVKIHAEITDDAVVSLLDLTEILGDILIVVRHFVAMVEHIGHLDVCREALSGSGSDHVVSVGVSLYDLCNAAELVGISQGRATEFHNFNSHLFLVLSGCKSVVFTNYYMKNSSFCQVFSRRFFELSKIFVKISEIHLQRDCKKQFFVIE